MAARCIGADEVSVSRASTFDLNLIELSSRTETGHAEKSGKAWSIRSCWRERSATMEDFGRGFVVRRVVVEGELQRCLAAESSPAGAATGSRTRASDNARAIEQQTERKRFWIDCEPMNTPFLTRCRRAQRVCTACRLRTARREDPYWQNSLHYFFGAALFVFDTGFFRSRRVEESAALNG
jgi:hypothetical protein